METPILYYNMNKVFLFLFVYKSDCKMSDPQEILFLRTCFVFNVYHALPGCKYTHCNILKSMHTQAHTCWEPQEKWSTNCLLSHRSKVRQAQIWEFTA